MTTSDVPPPAINITSVALANTGTNLDARVALTTNFGSHAGRIELLAADEATGGLSNVRLSLANHGGNIWEMAVPNLLTSMLQPLMGWTGSAPGPDRSYSWETPLLSTAKLPVTGGVAPYWTFAVDGVIYCKHLAENPADSDVFPVEIAHALLLNKATVTMMQDHQ